MYSYSQMINISLIYLVTYHFTHDPQSLFTVETDKIRYESPFVFLFSADWMLTVYSLRNQIVLPHLASTYVWEKSI